MKIQKFLFAFILLTFPVSSMAKSSLAAMVGASNLTANGSIYVSESSTEGFLAASYSTELTSQWRGFANLSSVTSGEALALGVGGAYHFSPYSTKSEVIDENVTVSQTFKWSPYIGFELTMTRLQMSLTQNQNSSNSDVVLASLFGSTLHLGSYYSWSDNISLIIDGFATYGVSSKVSASQLGISTGIVYFFP